MVINSYGSFPAEKEELLFSGAFSALYGLQKVYARVIVLTKLFVGHYCLTFISWVGYDY